MPPSWPSLALLAVALAGLAVTYVVTVRLLSLAKSSREAYGSEWRRAEARAEHMLAEVLPAEELRRLRQRGYLEVVSKQFADRTYRVPRFQGLVAVYEKGVLTTYLCVRSVEPIPDGDLVLMHKLLLEADESGYLKAANWIRPRPFVYTL
jgi:hypothetical protein